MAGDQPRGPPEGAAALNGPRRIVFRADASAEIGTGHLMRCLTLADEMGRRGWRTAFACAALPAPLADRLGAAGHPLIRLPAAAPGGSEPAAMLQPGERPLVVVDHYRLGAEWHDEARALGATVAAIDDLAGRPLRVSLLLNQNLGAGAEDYRGLVPEGCVCLIGPQYALLRPEFARLRRPPEGPRRLEHVLVFLGGGDTGGATAAAVSGAAEAGVEVDVVVGSASPSVGRVRRLAARHPRVAVHESTPEMAALMRRADLAVGAPGSASWERCCLGVPTLTITLADNQAAAGAALERAGATRSLGRVGDVDAATVRDAIVSLRDRPEVLGEMARAAYGVTDGRGVIRVADELAALAAGEGGR
ncbi:MAG TPA: UDP-2,4-diacetamido-2,4,6-trideoxy-beta-L-altropyranose hydrolase [Thermoanaerobaculia bacterium]|nr:UDP-2,4-diacetamido-2,4,6-trideoxy-beta-L-altropyranose hydrolase [Thermoanaerobaculia bacterium]